MPRKKRTIIDEDIPDKSLGITDNGDSLDTLDLPEMEDATLQSLMSRLKGASDYQVNIYTVTARGSEFRFTVDDPDILTEGYIQDNCGPGKYAIRILKDNIPVKSYYINIGAKPNSSTVPVISNTDDKMINMYRENSMFMQNMVLALINKEQNKPETSLTELVASMTTLQGIKQESTKDPLDMLTKAIELVQSIGGSGGDWKSQLISTAKDVLAPVAGELAKAALRNQSTPDNRALPSAGGFVEEVHDMVPEFILKKGLTWTKSQILSGMPVGLAIDWIILLAYR